MFMGDFVFARAACAFGRDIISSKIPTNIDIFSGGRGATARITRSISPHWRASIDLKTAVATKVDEKSRRFSSDIMSSRDPSGPANFLSAGRAVGHAVIAVGR